MKAIIVDDEKHVREGLLLLGDFESYGIETIYEAENGDQAIELILQHRPEFIFTDMRMPKKDGIELLKWIQEADLHSKTIVISGYDDFQYMRSALFYGSFDYILKPIDPDVLHQTLEKAVKEWKKQDLERQSLLEQNIVINEVKPLYWNHFFSKLLQQSTISSSEIAKIEKEFHVNLCNEQCTIALIPMKVIINKQFQGDVDLAFFTVLNICNEMLKTSQTGFAFRNMNNEFELIIILWKHKNINQLIEEIFSSIYQCLKVKCMIAVGQKHPANGELVPAYQSAVHVLLKHNLLENKKLNKIYTKQDLTLHPLTHLLDYSQEIKLAVQSASIEQVDQTLQKIYQPFKNQHYLSLEQLKVWENEIELLKNHWLKEYEISDQPSLYRGFDYWLDNGDFSFEKFEEEKQKEFHDLIKTLYDTEYRKEKNSMQQIEEYLHNHYQKDIKLQEIADQFFLSREYISRKFKQEFNENISDYIIKIRIEKAKTLLKNPHLKIYEIANQIGYQDDKYFSKVFKKMVGFTPNEYRKKVDN
ncbi:response regulator [Bacillus taeanensis]|uniref:DNA-binding response regulator n=1 Tax=Bacillus taeanensis TaxID=273032 RepID=A0A366XY86_9BACI|nr:response regulator [Bacillus taeanensis]RBW69113.1 DNA-binding response regulator [Bacillus taeanensis]